MGSKAKPPQAPDPYATAAAQAGFTADNVRMLANTNRVNQVGPYGSQTWTHDPNGPGGQDGGWTQNTTYDPRLQAVMDQQLANQGQQQDIAHSLYGNLMASGKYGQDIDTSGLPGMGDANSLNAGGLQTRLGPQGNIITDYGNAAQGVQGQVQGNGEAARKASENAAYASAASRLDPQYKQQQTDLETQLANQGVTQGSEAWQKAMDTFNRGKTDAYSTAQRAAVDQGQTAQSNQFAMNLGAGNFANSAHAQMVSDLLSKAGFTNSALGQKFQQGLQAATFGNQAKGQEFGQNMAKQQFATSNRQQALAEMLALRNQPLNEVNAITRGSTPTAPQFGPTQQITPSGAPNFGQYQNDAYQGQLNAYNANAGSSNSMMGALGSLGAGLLGGGTGSAGSLLMGALLSSRAAKDKVADVPEGQALEMVKRLPVDLWRYKGEDALHVGTYAEDFQAVTGLGATDVIAVVDAIGLLTGAVKDLAMRIERLEAR